MSTGNNTNSNEGPNENNSLKDEKSKDEQLPLHNPFKPGDDNPITQEDIENEQKYKEALTERD